MSEGPGAGGCFPERATGSGEGRLQLVEAGEVPVAGEVLRLLPQPFGCEPGVVMACADDVPTLETLAAVQILREHFPGLRLRVIKVLDLMTLQPQTEHLHGISDHDFDRLFTTNKPVIFAYHGYPWLIHRLTYRRTNDHKIHVRGYKEEGTTMTPFDMVVLNDLDQFHLVGDVIDRVPSLGARAAYAKQYIRDKLINQKKYIHQHGEEISEILNWKWRLGKSK